ncbi:MAG: phosphatase PAP2 family protein [Acidimicrobiia bacterium]
MSSAVSDAKTVPAPAPTRRPLLPAGALAGSRRWLALSGFVAASAIVVLALGEIPSRPYILFWLIGLAWVLCWRNDHPVARVVFDWLPVLVIAAGYDLVRSRAVDLVPRAVTDPQLQVDEFLFGGVVPTIRLQDWLVDAGTPHWWDYPVWVMYLSHFVVTPAVAVWLYLRHREWFHRYAILILGVCLAGFATYFILPAVPPWLASRDGALAPTTRVVHAVWDSIGIDSASKIFDGDARLANPVAALPSLHAAWPLMTLLFLWRKVGRWRWLLVAYNAAMVFVLVYGAEHYFSDILMGWVYVIVIYLVVNRLADDRLADDRLARMQGRTDPS